MQKSLHTILLTIVSMMMLHAQSGRISGKITDDLGLVMPGAAIWINTNPVKGTISDNAGKYQITGLYEGEFTMTITYLGYEDKIVNVSVFIY